MTYLGLDVPNYVFSHLPRIQPPGLGWGLAGYSEGGYCAANMALQPMLSTRFGASGVLSGYFAPYDNQYGGTIVNPFHGSRALRLRNTPDWAVRHLRPGEQVPQFWIGAGTGDQQDVQGAEEFHQLLSTYQAAPMQLIPGGHTMAVWRSQIYPMLEWMTPLLTQNALKIDHEAVLAASRLRDCATQPSTDSKSDPSSGLAPTGQVTPTPTPTTTPTPNPSTTPADCHPAKTGTKAGAKPTGKRVLTSRARHRKHKPRI
jgi:hypothetical protein